MRNECASKDEIIKILLSDKTITNSPTSSSNYLYPKKASKPPNDNNPSDIVTRNRFDCLTHEDDKDDDESNVMFIESKKNKPNDRYNKDKRHDDKRTNTGKQQQQRTITILGDSIIKDIKSHKIKQQLGTGENIFVKSFPGAKTSCMHDYVKPSLKLKSDLFILHCGTNDLKSEKSPEIIAKEILNLAAKMKQPANEVMISSITSRRDKLNQNAVTVNKHLKVLCCNEYIEYIDNSNISSETRLNNSDLHLNFKGTITVSNIRNNLVSTDKSLLLSIHPVLPII